MSTPAYKFRFPLQSLSADTLIGSGASSLVFAVSRRVAFKCPTIVEDSAGIQRSTGAQNNVDRINDEKQVYLVLMRNPHPNILRAILCADAGIFLQRLDCTLHDRLEHSTAGQIDPSTEFAWIHGLASGLSWLESLGYVHGDLRPANILLDSCDQVKICDFDATVKIGQPLQVATDPFCKVDEKFQPPLSGPASEQFAFGSCVYNIRYGQIPFCHLDAPTRVRKLMKSEFPSTSDDAECGGIVWNCWNGEYASLQKLQQDVQSRIPLFSDVCAVSADIGCSLVEAEEAQALHEECENFLGSNVL